MSLTTTLIEFLRSQGMSSDQIVEAVLLIEREQEMKGAYEVGPDTAAERKRAYDRQYQAERRQRQSYDNRTTSYEAGGLKEIPPTPPKENTTSPQSPSEITPRQSKSERMPDDWQPDASLTEYGAGVGLSDSETADEMAAMKAWALANAGRAVARKADWTQAAQGWLRRAAKAKKTGPPAGRIVSFPQHPSPKGNVLAAIRHLRSEAAGIADSGAGAGSPVEPSGRTGGNHAGLLSYRGGS